MIKISIIIPVYGVEKYIRQCLESVINQTYKNLEIIVVNDGTKDNSIRIVEEYLFDKRIKIINKENGGISSARNRGIEEATGEYVSFVDSDDWLEIDLYEKIIQILERDKAEIIVFNYNRYSENKKKYRRNILKLKKIPKEILFKNLNGECWNKLYKIEFLRENNLRFFEGIIYEDIIWEIETMHLVEKIKFYNYSGYNYRYDREGSIINTLKFSEIKKAYLKIIEKIDNILTKEMRYNLTKLQKKRLKLFKLELSLKLKEKIEFSEIKEKLKEYIWNDKKDIKFLKKDIQDILKIKNIKNINFFEPIYWIYGIYTLKVVLKLRKK